MNLRRFGVWANLAIAAALMLVVWALLVWVASRPALRGLIDLTPQRVNSVDPVTEDLLRELRAEGAKIEFHLFQQDLRGEAREPAERQALAIRGRLLDLTRILLRRYVAIGGESVTFVEQEPYRDSARYREAASRFGYTSADNEALVVAVEQEGKAPRWRKLSLISDLAVIEMPPAETSGPVKRLPVPVLKDYVGEKAISSSLKGLLVQGTPVAYVLRGYSTMVRFDDTSPVGYGGLIAGLVANGFEVRDLDLRKQPVVPADASVVMLLEPSSELVPTHADALYEYLRRGGRMFINYSWSPIPDMNPTGGRLGELLGYELSTQPVFHKVADVGRRAGSSIDGVEGVARLALKVNQLHPTTRRLAEARRPFEVAFGRALRERAGAPANVRREPLMQTGDEGWLAVPDRNGQLDLRAPEGVRLREYYVGMACELDVEDGANGGGERPAGAPATGQLVIVSGLFCNNASMAMFGDFALNVCNWMAERRVLLDIGGARYESTRLDIKPQQYDRVWWLLVVFVPNAFLALGALVWWRRRR